MSRPTIATRDRILNAAETRFSSYGFKRTSMEDIAGEAGISRAALYLQFRNKEEIFRGLSRALLDGALKEASLGLSNQESLAQALITAAEGMNLGIVEIVYASPHGSELLDQKNRLCGNQVAAAVQTYRKILATIFRRAMARGEIDLTSSGLNPSSAAELYHRAALGLMGPDVKREAYQKNLRTLTKLVVAGLGGTMNARRSKTC
jgi:AcrR family transcriptional regulator